MLAWAEPPLGSIACKNQDSNRSCARVKMRFEHSRTTIWGAVLIVVVTTLLYWPSLGGGFLLDDDILLTNNRLIQSPRGLAGFWFTSEAPDYWPLTSTTLWLEWRLWMLNPLGYRLMNMILHIVDCIF